MLLFFAMVALRGGGYRPPPIDELASIVKGATEVRTTLPTYATTDVDWLEPDPEGRLRIGDKVFVPPNLEGKVIGHTVIPCVSYKLPRPFEVVSKRMRAKFSHLKEWHNTAGSAVIMGFYKLQADGSSGTSIDVCRATDHGQTDVTVAYFGNPIPCVTRAGQS